MRRSCGVAVVGRQEAAQLGTRRKMGVDRQIRVCCFQSRADREGKTKAQARRTQIARGAVSACCRNECLESDAGGTRRGSCQTPRLGALGEAVDGGTQGTQDLGRWTGALGEHGRECRVQSAECRPLMENHGCARADGERMTCVSTTTSPAHDDKKVLVPGTALETRKSRWTMSCSNLHRCRHVGSLSLWTAGVAAPVCSPCFEPIGHCGAPLGPTCPSTSEGSTRPTTA